MWFAARWRVECGRMQVECRFVVAHGFGREWGCAVFGGAGDISEARDPVRVTSEGIVGYMPSQWVLKMDQVSRWNDDS